MNDERRPARNAAASTSDANGTEALADYLTHAAIMQLGFGRRAADRFFEELPVLKIEGHRRLFIRRADLEAYIAAHTYRPDQVRP